MRKELPVDAGMIGIVPVAAIQRHENGYPDGGMVIKVQGGRYLNLHYCDGRITITADLNGAVPVLEDTEFWVGDVCYVLDNNIPITDPNWDKSPNPAPGYWAACLMSFQTPRHDAGGWFSKPFRLDGGLAGLVSATKWGDGLYPAVATTDGIYTVCVTVDTGDEDEDEEE